MTEQELLKDMAEHAASSASQSDPSPLVGFGFRVHVGGSHVTSTAIFRSNILVYD